MSETVIDKETERLNLLYSYEILDTPNEDAYDDIVCLAAHICGTSMAVISFVDAERQWFKSSFGVEIKQTPRDISFCTHAIEQTDIFIVSDALSDSRFSSSPLVNGDPHINFYAGVPLMAPDGLALGTLCVFDSAAKELTSKQLSALRSLANLVINQLALRMSDALSRRILKQREHLFASIPSIMIAVDNKGLITSWNSAAEQVLGVDAQDAVGINFSDCPVDWSLDVNSPAIRNAIANKKTVNLEDVELRTGQGATRLLGVRLSAVSDDEGFLIYGADITSRRQHELAVREAEEDYKRIFENSPDGIFRTTADGKFLSVNPALAKILGYSNAEDLIESVHDIAIDVYEVPERRAELIDQLSTSDLVSGFEFQARRRDGDLVFVSLTARNLWGKDGIRCIEGRVVDLTQRLKYEEALRETNQRLETLVQASPLAIVTTDDSFVIRSWNPAAELIFGWTAAESIGKFLPMLPNRSLKAIEDIRSCLLKGESVIGSDRDAIRKDGKTIQVSVSTSPIMDSNGRMTSTIALVSDITSRKNSELQLALATRKLEDRNWELAEARDAALAAVKAKSEFLANMSHEIRTPMNGVICMLELLVDTALVGEQVFFAKTAKNSAQSLLTVINDILDFSKMEAGKMTIEHVPFAVRETLEDAAQMAAVQAKEKGISFTCELRPLGESDCDDWVLGAPDRLRQIVGNVLTNAVKFTPKGGEVALGAEVISQTPTSVRWIIYALDTGIGVPYDRQSLIFESFTQADGSTTRKYGGTGLGLTICRQLATLMGGEIFVESKPGEGSTFWIDITFEKQSSGSQSKNYQATELERRGLNILLVGSAGRGRDHIARCLANWGHLVAVQNADIDALNNDAIDYDLLILNGDCFEVSRLPDWLQRAEAPIVLVADSDFTAEGRLLGRSVFFVRRPLRQKELIAAITERGNWHQTAPAARTKKDQPIPLMRGTILLAEDNLVNQEVAQCMLERLGYPSDCIDIVTNGEEALAALEQKSYDLILLDIQMPIMDGLETSAAIRKRETSKSYHQPIIAMTAHALPEDAERCLAAGMDDYISKPITMEKLAAIMSRWVPLSAQLAEQTATERIQAGSLLDLNVLGDITGGSALNQTAILKTALQVTPGMLMRCRLMVEMQDCVGIEHWAHTLKGTGQVLGANSYTCMCQELEDVGRSEDFYNAAALLIKLEEQWKLIDAEITDLLKGTSRI
jgi:PAS domain S-box-containing protein